MRSVRRITLGLASVACVFAVTALPAMASAPEFESSGGTLVGKAEGEQAFRLGAFHVICQHAHAEGLDSSTPTSSKTLGISVKYQKCATEAKIAGNPIWLATRFVTPFDIEYNANGLVQQIGSETSEPFAGSGEVVVKGGEVELKIRAIKCHVVIEPQSVPFKPGKKKTEFESAEFENETREVGKKTYNELLVTNVWKGLHYEYGEGQCEEFKKAEEERSGGKYEGQLRLLVRKGNLSFS
jgi:hypothetical protein